MPARQASNAGSVCLLCRLDNVHSTTNAGYNNTHAIEGETSWRAVLVHWHDLEHLKAAQIT
jgi:hypothetical protein